MEIVHLLERLLYEVASALYLPVIASCALLIAYTPLQLGMALFEAWQRRRRRFDQREAFARRLQGLQFDLRAAPQRCSLRWFFS